MNEDNITVHYRTTIIPGPPGVEAWIASEDGEVMGSYPILAVCIIAQDISCDAIVESTTVRAKATEKLVTHTWIDTPGHVDKFSSAKYLEVSYLLADGPFDDENEWWERQYIAFSKEAAESKAANMKTRAAAAAQRKA